MIPVRFTRPPVVEVVCGVQFATPDVTLKTAHIGLLWQHYAAEFPRIEDVPPLGHPLDQLGPAGADLQVSSVELVRVPPIRRSWFVDNEGAHLVQVQEDRLLFNWKRTGETYPSYEVVIAKFESVLEKFLAFVREAKVGNLVFRQFELTYVNHVDQEHGLGQFSIGELFADHNFRKGERFLPSPDGINWKTSYLMPDSLGRLHVGIRTASRASDRSRVVRMDLTVRGLPRDVTDEKRRHWFDNAHQWITHGFVDLTSGDLHKLWGRVS